MSKKGILKYFLRNNIRAYVLRLTLFILPIVFLFKQYKFGMLTLIPQNDFIKQYTNIKKEIDEAIQTVLLSGWYILGEQVKMFERDFSLYCGTKNGIGVGNGLDALYLALRACGVGNGDEVITVANTAFATAIAISRLGATPVFTEVDETTYNMDPTQISNVITNKTKAIIPVHMFGNPVDMDPVMEIAEENDLLVIEDACQAHGAEYKGKKVGSIGDLGCFSFYPTKNLGAYGDGGMIITNRDDYSEDISQLRNYGQQTQYVHTKKGINSRLDEIQAAILSVKLKYLDQWNNERRENSSIYYSKMCNEKVGLPVETPGAKSVFHLFVIQCRHRNDLAKYLYRKGVMTKVHYPIPLHLQLSYRTDVSSSIKLPITERLSQEILSLPISPEISRAQILKVIHNIQHFYSNK